MNQKFSFRAIQQGQTQQSHVVNAGAGQNGQALVVRAAAGMRYQLADLLTLTSPKKLQLKRVGQDLMVALPGNDVTSPDIVIKDYFNFKDLSLSGLAASGEPMVYDTSSSFNIGQSATGITPESLAANKTTAATLATASGGWFDGGMGLAALGGGGLLLAAAGGGGSDSTTNAGLTKITTYKGDATKSVPTVTDFATAGVTGVDSGNLAGVNSFLTATALPLDNSVSVQTLVDSYNRITQKANGSAVDTSADDPTSADYRNLMGISIPSSLNSESAEYKVGAVALLNDRIKTLNYSDIAKFNSTPSLITYAAAVQAIANLAIADPSTTGTAATTGNITAAQLTSLGVDVTATSLTAVSDAIRADAGDLSGLNTTAKLSALVKAYNLILAEAIGTTKDATVTNPSAADYAAIGADIGTAKTDTAAIDRLNKIVGNLASTAVDTVGEITKLAATLDKIQTVAALATGATLTDAQKFSADELKNLGLTGFTGTETQNTALALKVSETIRDKAVADVVAGTNTGTKLETNGSKSNFDQTQLERLQALVSQEIIKNYVVNTTDSSKTTLAPTLADWKAAGIFKNHATEPGKFAEIDSTDLAYLNSAVDTLTTDKTNTIGLQAIADSYVKIIREANGSSVDATPDVNATVTDYANIGVIGKVADASAAHHVNALKMLNDLVAVRSSTDVDTVKEIQTLADLVDKVYNLAALATGATLTDAQKLSVTDLTTLLGASALTSTTVNNNELANKISQAIRDKDAADLGAGDFTNGKLHATDGTRITWSQTPIERLQTLVSLEIIKNYVVVPATDTTATTTQLPTPTDWSNVGVFHNPATNTDTAMTAWTGLTSTEIIALNSVVDKLLPTASTLTSTSELQLLADAYARVLQEANGSGDSNGDKNNGLNPSHEDMARLGLTGAVATAGDTFDLLLEVIANRSSSDVDTFTELKALADAATKIVEAAGNTDVTNFTQDELNKAGLLSSANATLNATGLAYLEAQLRALNDSALVDTVAEVKTQFALAMVRAWAVAPDNNTADSLVTKDPFKPTISDYANFTGIQRLDRTTVLPPTSGSSFTLTQHDVDALNTVLDNLPDASFDTLAKLKTVAESLFRILNEANGSTADANTTTAGTAVQQDYINIGLTGMVTTDAGAAKLLNTVVSNQIYTADNAGETSGVDTWTELQKLSTTTDKFLKYADNVSGAVAPDSADFKLLGISGVESTYNLTNILSKIDTANAAGIDTFDEIQSLVSHQRIIDYAADSTASNTAGAPTFVDWSSLRLAEGSDLAGELQTNVTVYNKAVEYKVATGVDQLSELQTLVTDYNAYVTDWTSRGVDATNMVAATDLFNSLSTGNQTSANAIIVGKLIDLAERDGASTNPTGAPFNFTGTDLTKADLTALGLTTINIGNGSGTYDAHELSNIWVAIQMRTPSGSSNISSLSELQGIINTWAPL